MKLNAQIHPRGLSLLEVLLTVSVLAIVGAFAISKTSNIHDGVRNTKLEQDVKNINSAIQIYVANGGKLDGISDPQEVLDRMKSARSTNDKMQFVGLTGSTLDKRLATRTGEANAKSAAVWSDQDLRFEIGQASSAGVTSFFLDESLAGKIYEAVDREVSVVAYNDKPGWIWGYEDKIAALPGGITDVTLGNPIDTTPPPVPVRLTTPAVTGGGTFPSSDFPKTVSIINPNDSSTWLMFSIDGDPFTQYTGPFTIASAGTVAAYATGDPTFWINSGDAYAAFAELPPTPPSQLSSPIINLSSNQFNDSTSEITVSITNPNLTGSSSLYYSIVDQGSSHPPQSAFQPFAGALTTNVANYPAGFDVVTYAKSSDPLKYIDSFPASAFTTTEFFEIPVVGNVLFVVDASSSMGNSFGNTTRFEATIDELTQAIDTLPSNLKFNVAMFDAAIHWTDGTFQLHQANAQKKQTLINQIQQLDHGSGTNYAAAFGLPQMYNPVPDQVIFLSDGEPNSDPYQSLLNNLATAGIRIDAVGLDLDNSATSVLEQIVNLTGGTLVEVGDP